jgi:outer membrane protein, heavy metal efflux system
VNVKRTAVALAITIASAGCQRYQPKPLDVAGYQSAWSARTPAHENVVLFAQRLAESGEPPPGEFNPADGLSLVEAEVVALVFNPELRSARARASVTAASAEFAGLWDDPVFSLDLLRIVESVPDPWILGTSLGFTIPLSGRLEVEKSRADAEHQVALALAAQLEWQTLGELRSIWLQWSSVKLQAEVLNELVDRLGRIAEMTDRLEQAGEIPRIESRLFRIELVTRTNDFQALEAGAEDLALQIKALLGMRPESEFAMEPMVSMTAPADATEEFMMQSNPALAVARAEYEVAERTLDREIRKQYPDLEIGPAYENEEDQSRIGFIGSLPIPLLNRNRQGIAEAQAQREAARIEFEAAFEQQVQELARARTEHRLREQLRAGLESSLIPLVEDQARDAQRMIELGELNTLIQLESMVRRAEAKLKLIEARQGEAQSANRIRSALGPPANQESQEAQP